jgi:hypothetical protein
MTRNRYDRRGKIKGVVAKKTTVGSLDGSGKKRDSIIIKKDGRPYLVFEVVDQEKERNKAYKYFEL